MNAVSRMEGVISVRSVLMKTNRSIIGKQSKTKGEIAEDLFKKTYEYAGGLVYKIKEGGVLTKSGQFYRTSQLCDFIVIFNGRPAYLIDCKTLPKKKITISFFQGKKKNGDPDSTAQQYINFLKINRKAGYICGFFHFIDIENNLHYNLTPRTEDKFDFNHVPGGSSLTGVKKE